MFASQLLRILQTIPSDAKRASCVHDSADQDMTMTENEQREAHSLAFGNKEIYIKETNNHPPLFDAKGSSRGRDDLFLAEFSTDNQNRTTRDSTAEEFTVRPLCRLSSYDDDEDSLSSDTNVIDKEQNPMTDQIRPVCRPSSFEEEEDTDSVSSWTNPMTVEEFTDGNNEREYSGVDLFRTDDKNELEYDRPEIIVCYKEINYHVVEDICIDGDSFDQPINGDDDDDGGDDDDGDDGDGDGDGDNDMELFPSDELATSSSSSGSTNAKDVSSNEDESREENPFDSMKKGEMKIGENSSKKDSFVDKTLPIQEFGTRSFLRSFINSFDGDDNINNNNIKVEHLQDHQEIISSSAEAKPKEDVQAKSLIFKSKVESRSITFNFKSPPPAPASATKQITEEQSIIGAGGTKQIIEEQSIIGAGGTKQIIEEQSIIGSDNKTAEADNLIIGEIIEEQPVKTNDVFSDDISATTKKDNRFEMQISPEIEIISPKITLQNNAKESDDVSSSSGKSVNSVNNEVFVAESNFLKRDEGETSFSAGGLITFSGAVPYSGSISHRSDGSATSGRSFAFPVLQEEWNSSPERIPKDGDGRHFRKHKGWRSGLLCCRF